MKDTRDRILSEGLDLLSRGGFEGVTLGVLAQQTKISKSGLFAHFGSKEEVQLGLMDEMMRLVAESFADAALRQPKGLRRLRSMVVGWLGWSQKAGLHGGCPAVAGMFELDDVPLTDRVRQRLVIIEERWRATLATLVREAIETGEFRTDLHVNQFVWELVGIYLSHHVSHRFRRDPLATKRAMTAFSGLVERSSAKAAKIKGRVRNR